MKAILFHLKKPIKLLILILLGVFLIGTLLYFLYKPMYAVYLDGKLVGYTEEKTKLQDRINSYVKSGDGKKIAFYEIEELPSYEICYSKKDLKNNDDEIFEKVISQGTPYYKQYAILVNKEEKYYVSDYKSAEKVINTLKEKKSTNIKNISYSVKYTSDEKLEETDTEKIVSSLYKKPVVKKTEVESISYSGTIRYKSAGTVSTSLNISNKKVALGITLKKPVSGTISSKFGVRSSIRKSAHTGLDIAAPKGRDIKAAAAGTVSYAGWKGSYGNLIVISHGNGIQTYYAHCSKLNVTAGQNISQGQVIGKVGSTGNSTGPHLHFEVRINGVAHNPQNYLY